MRRGAARGGPTLPRGRKTVLFQTAVGTWGSPRGTWASGREGAERIPRRRDDGSCARCGSRGDTDGPTRRAAPRAAASPRGAPGKVGTTDPEVVAPLPLLQGVSSREIIQRGKNRKENCMPRK